MSVSVRIILISIISLAQVPHSYSQNGKVLMEKGMVNLYSNTDSARLYFDKAFVAFIQSSDSPSAYTCKYYYGSTFFVERNHQQAFDLFLTYTDEMLRFKLNNPTVLGLFYNGLGFTSRDLNRFNESEKYFLAGIEICKSNGVDETLSKLQSNLSQLYKIKGEYRKAEQILLSMLENKDASDESLESLYTNLGDLYSRYLMQPEKAHNYLDKALEITTRLYGSASIKYGNGLLTKGTSFFYNQEYERAIEFWGKAKNIYANNSDLEGVSFALNNMGRAYQQLGDLTNAIVYTEQALALKEKLMGTNSLSTLLSYANLGRLYFFDGNLIKSNQYIDFTLKKLHEIFREVHPELARVYGFKATNLVAEKKYKQGIEALYTGYTSVAKVTLEENKLAPPKAVPFQPAEYALLLGLHATILKDSIQATSFNASLADWAVACLHLGDQALMNVRYGILPNDALAMTGVDSEFYKSASDVCFAFYSASDDEKYFNEFLYFSDKQKGFNLLVATQERERPEGLIPVTIAEKEQQFRQQLARQLTNVKKGVVSDSLFDVQLQYTTLLSEISQQYPAYNSWKFGTTPATLDQIQVQLGNRAVIDYVVTDSSLFITLITTRDKRITKVRVSQNELNEMINTFRSAMLEQNASEVDRAGHQLYKWLIQPTEDVLKKQQGPIQVILIPDGLLCHVPFEALVQKPKAKPLERFLIKDYVFSVQYNLSLAFKDKTGTTSGDLLAFAPVYDSKSASVLRSGLSDLPFAQKEAETVVSLLGGRVVKGVEATAENFRKLVKGASVIHVASHILLNEFNPDESSILFSSPGESEELDELTTFELYSMDLKADLVTLSGCNSGSGKIKNGEGVMSLARAFMYAGCSNIVMSLWQVSDESTNELMEYFYANLKKGVSKDEALRLAKLEFLENADEVKANPYYWSGFVYSGNQLPLQTGKNLWSTIGLIALTILTLVFLFWKARKPRVA